MPEYLAPGVFVEEVSFRQKTIEGVSTSTAGFVGPTRFGPVGGEPELLTSFADFERIYGGLDPLELGGTPTINYLAQGVRAFFEEGGRRLYVSRVFSSANDDIALWKAVNSDLELKARYPGRAGNVTVTFVFRLGENVLDAGPIPPVLRGARAGDTALVGKQGNLDLFWLERKFDEVSGTFTFELHSADGSTTPIADVDEVRILTVSVIVERPGRFAQEVAWEDLAFHPTHRRSLSEVFAETPDRRGDALTVPLVFDPDTLDNGAAIADALLDEAGVALSDLQSGPAPSFRVGLRDGLDGDAPSATEYETGLTALEDVEDVSMVAAPGSTAESDPGEGVARALISHCERMRYRVAVLDSIQGDGLSAVREQRARIDSTRAALYYPWVRTLDPVSEKMIELPPSGFLAGIWARNDVQFGVHKSPANEVVRLAAGFERVINTAQQEGLNPLGINCLRFFEGRGFRVWGARTATSDPEWKYVNVRRYFAFLERSIERGTQWAVFENNGPKLWGNVRSTVEDFLFNEFQSNHLLGTTPDEAYFVRCDRTTMTQNDLDNGRLVCLVGVSPLRPAEFVIFRIGQKTADSTS